MRRKSQPDEPADSPIDFCPPSNGEYVPRARSARDRRAIELYQRLQDDAARKLGVTRRQFAMSACGSATALFVINQVYGCGSQPSYAVDAGMMLDAAKACERLSGSDFIFDVQTHHVNPMGAWRAADPGSWAKTLATFPYAGCGEPDRVACFGVGRYLREIFVNSETHVACLSGVPSTTVGDPLLNDERVATLEIADRLASSQRLLMHVSVLPDRGAPQLDAMQAWAESKKPVAAWKVYPSFGSWQLDAAVGTTFIDRARAVGVKVICAHRGISGDAGGYMDISSPRDLVAAAKMFPDVTFIAYHSGWELNVAEGPYNAANPRGIDRLVKAMIDHGNPPNVYAELGSTWRGVMTSPTQAAHVIGKLLKYLGEDRILYGSDCIWYGSPQEQIVALRALTIPPAMQQAEGYPALTADIKKKIFGLNAARVYGVDPNAVRCAIKGDDIDMLKLGSLDEDRVPSRGVGPRTRRELFALLRGRPV